MNVKPPEIFTGFKSNVHPISTKAHFVKPKDKKLPWPSDYELQLSLERSQVLILVKVIGG